MKLKELADQVSKAIFQDRNEREYFWNFKEEYLVYFNQKEVSPISRVIYECKTDHGFNDIYLMNLKYICDLIREHSCILNENLVLDKEELENLLENDYLADYSESDKFIKEAVKAIDLFDKVARQEYTNYYDVLDQAYLVWLKDLSSSVYDKLNDLISEKERKDSNV